MRAWRTSSTRTGTRASYTPATHRCTIAGRARPDRRRMGRARPDRRRMGRARPDRRRIRASFTRSATAWGSRYTNARFWAGVARRSCRATSSHSSRVSTMRALAECGSARPQNSVDSPDDLSYGPDGLLPVVVQDASTKEVLMLAYADAEAVRRTIATRTTWFWSRSRRAYWNKGASSGNIQTVVEIRYDCDADALLVLVDPAGPACHTGERSCFFRSLESSNQRRDLRRE